MFRVIDSAKHILERVRMIVKEYQGVEVEVLGINEPILLTSKPITFVIICSFRTPKTL